MDLLVAIIVKKWLIIALMTVVVVIVIGFRSLLVSKSQQPVREQLALLFGGFTNIPSIGNCAILTLTNPTSVRIAFVFHAVEHRTPSGWATNLMRGESRQWLMSWFRLPDDIPPFQTLSYFVPQPVTNEAWRIRFLCLEQADGVRQLSDRVKDELNNAIADRGSQPRMTFSGRKYSIESPEIRP